ncbi:uncharacterized protein LOC110467478 [Mizuhopecten yessoensis]|uniref:Uncharacterized protein n=1 Tax=Mizuhopecten yessoensis TaxID=6573 RepID=A0A210PLS3_MIZYE|nr:uncharacterized protein LOC110467478 [Mizuhopecten yessoensis]OWF37414.1 hypothetical protein KP79_PYT04745 [Mizuhopecten yessoensis]
MSNAGSTSISWRTESAASSYDVTKPMTSNSSVPRKKKMNVASAKNSGMKFPSWTGGKPIRASRSSSPRDHLQSNQGNFPIIRRSLDVKGEHNVNNIVSRLSTPTLSAKMKNVKYKPNVAMMNMNYYSWANMAAYKDHQRTLYTGNGTMKRSNCKSAKR